MKKKAKFSDLIVALVVVAFGIFVFFYSQATMKTQVPAGISPKDFPTLISIVITFLGFVLLIPVLISGVEKPQNTMTKKQFCKLIAVAASIFIYVEIVTKIGFLLLTPVLLFVLMLLFGVESKVKGAIISIIFSVAIYALFTKAFMIFLPKGILYF